MKPTGFLVTRTRSTMPYGNPSATFGNPSDTLGNTCDSVGYPSGCLGNPSGYLWKKRKQQSKPGVNPQGPLGHP
eukprot:9481513-Pyramimonas_sp.AAC.1